MAFRYRIGVEFKFLTLACYRLEGSQEFFALSFDNLSESVKHGIELAETRAEIA